MNESLGSCVNSPAKGLAIEAVVENAKSSVAGGHVAVRFHNWQNCVRTMTPFTSSQSEWIVVILSIERRMAALTSMLKTTS